MLFCFDQLINVTYFLWDLQSLDLKELPKPKLTLYCADFLSQFSSAKDPDYYQAAWTFKCFSNFLFLKLGPGHGIWAERREEVREEEEKSKNTSQAPLTATPHLSPSPFLSWGTPPHTQHPPTCRHASPRCLSVHNSPQPHNDRLSFLINSCALPHYPSFFLPPPLLISWLFSRYLTSPTPAHFLSLGLNCLIFSNITTNSQPFAQKLFVFPRAPFRPENICLSVPFYPQHSFLPKRKDNL